MAAATKKAEAAGDSPKKTAAPHATYLEMVQAAISTLKIRSGASRQAIKKYIRSNYALDGTTEAAFTSHLNLAIRRGVQKGVLTQPKGASGPIKIAKVAKPTKSKSSSKTESDASKEVAKESKPKKAEPSKPKKVSTLSSSTEKPSKLKKAQPAPAPTKSRAVAPKEKTASKKNENKKAEVSTASGKENKPAAADVSKVRSGRVGKRAASPKEVNSSPKKTSKAVTSEAKAGTRKSTRTKAVAAK